MIDEKRFGDVTFFEKFFAKTKISSTFALAKRNWAMV